MYITIGIPIYNAERYLSDAIKSVLAQTYQHWELILVDDGSIDNSLEIAQNFAKKDNRIRVISDGENKKLPARLNQIIREAKYDYIARMDADDLMHPERLKKQIIFLEKNPGYDLVSTGLISIDNNNKVKGFRKVEHIFTDFNKPKLSYPVVHPSILVRKSWYIRNQYSENFPRAEDFELWSRTIMYNDFRMAVLPDLLLFYREEGNLFSDKIVNSYKDILRIYSNYHSASKIEIFKLNLKILLVKFLDVTGNLQKLSSKRNSFFKSNDDKENFQKILDSIVN
jgi:glycosyltransferase involved in cell wall biosynthesis